MNSGIVYLVGAGPGDPGLLTVKGKECLEQADVVLYDYLANPVLLDHAPAHAERIYVGRRGRGRYQDQTEINQLLIERAQAGQVVVRLKGGSLRLRARRGRSRSRCGGRSAVRSRAGRDSRHRRPSLRRHPAMHRTLASTMTVVTGHEDPSKGTTVIDWRSWQQRRARWSS